MNLSNRILKFLYNHGDGNFVDVYAYFVKGEITKENIDRICKDMNDYIETEHVYEQRGMRSLISNTREENNIPEVLRVRINQKGRERYEDILNKKNIIYVTGHAQVNIANDNSTISATQNNGIDYNELERLISNLLAHVDSIEDKKDREIANERIEVIREELRKDRPRKSILNAAINAIKAVAGTAEFVAAALAIYTFINSISL